MRLHSIVALSVFALTLSLAGRAGAQELTPVPPSLTFGGQLIGTSSQSQSVTWSNLSGGPQEVAMLTIVGADAADFQLTDGNAYPADLNDQASLADVTVVFAPQGGVGGGRSANLEATMMDGSTVDCALSGTALGPQVIKVDSATADFASVCGGVTSAPFTLHISNGGDADLSVQGVAIANVLDAGDFSLDLLGNVFPLTLAAGKGIDVNVSFAPTMLGPRSGELDITSDDPKNPLLMVSLTGTGAGSDLSAAPMMLDFGNQVIFGASAPQEVTITNAGACPANITAVGFANGGASWFTTNGLQMPPFKVPALGTAKILVVSIPLAVGPGADTLTLTTDNPMTPSFDVALTVTGIAGSIMAAPAAADLGQVMVGAMGTKSVTITNVGQAPLEIDVVTLRDINDLNISLTIPVDLQTLPFMLAPAASETLMVSCTPPMGGQFANEIDIDLNGDPNVSHLHIPIVCTGVQATLSVTPAMLPFGSILTGTTSPTQTATIANTGTADLMINTVTLAGADAAQFQIVAAPGNGGAFTVPAGQNKTVTVAYQPTAMGTHTANLVVTPAGGLAPAQVKLTGSAESPMLSASPQMVAFPDADKAIVGFKDKNKQTVTLHVPATATVAVVLTGIASSSAEFIVDSSATNNNLAPGGTTTFDVYFQPAMKGTRSGTITVSVKGMSSGPIASIPATGVGVDETVTSTQSGGGCAVNGGAADNAGLLFLALPALVTLLRRRRAATTSKRTP